MKFTDKTTQTTTQRTITKDGFLVVPATISKVGVFDYLATELGLKEDGIKKVARTENSLFSDETINSKYSIGKSPAEITRSTSLYRSLILML